MKDNIGRNIDYLRISVTDRCNLRCVYCMPEEYSTEILENKILEFSEIIKIVKSCAKLGIKKIRITGGEPLVRCDIHKLIKSIKDIDGIEEVSMTTNGVLLPKFIDDLVDAGLDRVNISLDTLDPIKFKEITKLGNVQDVLQGIKVSIEKGLKPVKLNVVVMKEVNFHEILDFVKLTEEYPLDVRFIELMPIGIGKTYTPVSNNEVLEYIKRYKEIEKSKDVIGNGPAKHIKVKNSKGNIGFISAMTHEFCNDCNRVRLTKDGFLKLCLHWNYGVNLRKYIKGGITEEELTNLIKDTIEKKPEKHDFKYVFEESKNKYDKRKMFEIGG